MKAGARLKIRLISNQGLSSELNEAVCARWSGNLAGAGLDAQLVRNLETLRAAAGLSESDFPEFLQSLDFGQTGRASRFATKARVFDLVATALGNDVSSEVRELQSRIRELMLPERRGEFIAEEDVLLWFGLSGRDGLFPSPADIRLPANPIPRAAAKDAIDLLKAGQQLLLVHGAGGCGKTTLMRQIADRLPGGSVSIVFDCFGGGRCIYSDDKRHLPENAFLQLTNELALALKLPLFIPRNFKHPATIQSFLSKVRTAGEALRLYSPDALLLITIDAADNSVSAAESSDSKERPFIFDLAEAHLGKLPANVRFVFSARTARRDSLRLPAGTREVVCPAFSRDETQLHLDRAFTSVSDALVEQFHSLSNANPRVQAYAIAAAAGDLTRAIAVLLPDGKSLPDVLQATFDTALQKLGQRTIFEKLVAALAYLPAPAVVSAVAGVAGSTDDAVRDLALDLSPGLRLKDDTISTADEDFHSFIKDRAGSVRAAVTRDIATYFTARYKTDAYCSFHLADALIAADRAQEVASVIDRDPHAAAIGDPILRRQVQVRRLKLSLAACRHAGSTQDALRTILISAEAERDDSTLADVLAKELDLSVEFGGSSLRRTILLDPDRVRDHGSFLAQDAVRAIRARDRVTAREQLHFYAAWLRRRREIPKDQLSDWGITDRDVAARVETILALGGPTAALREAMSWRPRTVPLRVADILVPQLIASGRADQARALLDEASIPRPWDLLVRVPLAMAGVPIDVPALENSLRRIRRRVIPDSNALAPKYGGENWPGQLLDTFITACELGYLVGADNTTIRAAVTRVLEVLHGKQSRQLYTSEAHRLDGLLRSWLLEATASGKPLKEHDFLDYIRTLDPPSTVPTSLRARRTKSKKEKQQDRQGKERHRQEEERRDKRIRALFPLYVARIDILASGVKGDQITSKQLDAVGAIASTFYDFDYDHDSTYLRETAACSVMRLLIVNSISAKDLTARAGSLVQGRHVDYFAARRLPLWRAMRLRTAESEVLVDFVAQSARAIRAQRAAASDKLGSMVHLSRLLLPISPCDAEALFNDAVSIAKEIDLEAIDQIDFLSAAAERAKVAGKDERRQIASNIFTFVSGAAERLSDRDGFPWRSGVHALACLDAPIGLAAICRWADDGTAKLDTTLNAFLSTALQRAILAPDTAQALTLLLTAADEKLHKQLVSLAAGSAANGKALLEELSKDVLLLHPQGARHALGKEITDKACADQKPDGPWLSRLKETVAFVEAKLQQPHAKPPSAPTTAVRPLRNDELPKEFEFDPKGQAFVASDAIAEVLKAAASSGLRHSDRELVHKMRRASAKPQDRVPFLTALSELPEDTAWATDRVAFISEAVSEWRGIPAVDQWRRNVLPRIIVAQFSGATRWLKEGNAALPTLLDLTELDGEGRLRTILEGVSESGAALSSRTLFGIADIVAGGLEAGDTALILSWYAARLRARLPAEDQESIPLEDIPLEITEAIGRFLFALMSDIDTRVRWKAAHALRRLGRLRSLQPLAAAVAEHGRSKDDAFRDPTAPFYFLAARLWLLLALYRIAAETPEALKDCKDVLLGLATSRDLPHIGIREYAKRALMQLGSANVVSLSSAEQAQLSVVNRPAKGTVAKERHSYRSSDRTTRKESRFKFDVMDTIPYWYSDILGIFPAISQAKVLELADRWILDKWGADPEANRWDKEPRKARYDERRFPLWSHRHGEHPTVERYGTYLEWNAMHCVIGELLLTHRVSNESGYGSLDYWIGESLPTEPPEWLCDHRGATPLEPRFWMDDPRTDNGWIRKMRLEEFQWEIFGQPPRDGWVAVAASHTSHLAKRDAHVLISTALVSNGTASALVRALQTATNPRDFRIPTEDDNLQFDKPPYCLKGWLAYNENSMRFDERDPLRYEVHRICRAPGREITALLKLVAKQGTTRAWLSMDTKTPAFVYETWCDEPERDQDYDSRAARCDGWRLWASPEAIKSLLMKSEMDLICEVEVDRRLRSEYHRSYEPETKKKTFHKILLLRADGSVEDAKGRIGTWEGSHRRA